MTVGRAAINASQALTARAVVWAVGAVIGALAMLLWIVQLPGLAAACTVPDCAWPRLSEVGFASLEALGVGPPAWAVVAGGLALVWSAVPFLLGVAVARTDAESWLPVLWFLFSLGALSAVPTTPFLAALLHVLTLGTWFTLFALFPTGRFRPRWVALAPAMAVAWTVVLVLPVVQSAEAANDALWWTLEPVGYVACIAAIVAAQIVQFPTADAAARRGLRLLLVPLALFVVLGVTTAVLNAGLDATRFGYGTLGGAVLYELSSLLTVVLLGCVAISTLRDQAFGVRIALDRVLVATVAVAIAAVVYATVALLASVAMSGWAASALAAVATAVALAGLFGRVARAIGRLVYGDADDPAAVVAALDARVARASAAEQLLPGIAATLAERLRFPGVRIVLDDAATGQAGVLAAPSASVPLTLAGRPVGEIEVSLRPGQRRLSERDRAALTAASGPVAAAATARRLNEELGRSRLEVLISRDDERRTLRRRLHDEIGPTLALAGHRITAARDDPSQLEAASRTIADALAQVRAISRDLRPPALDELGLRAAIEAFAAGLSVDAEVSAPENVVPGVVEVALYRIAVEALFNIARHADASRAVVTLAAGPDGWILQVDDDGCGMSPDAVLGVGISSMRERAEELGGSVDIGRSPLGGTRVRAVLAVDWKTPT